MKEIVISPTDRPEALAAAVNEADTDTVIVVGTAQQIGLAFAMGERAGKALTVRFRGKRD